MNDLRPPREVIPSHSVENLKALFEPGKATIDDLGFSSRHERLKDLHDASDMVRERIELFEKGDYKDCEVECTRRCSWDDLQAMMRSNLPSRKSELEDRFARSCHSSSGTSHKGHAASSTRVDAVLEKFKTTHVPRQGRRRAYRRASTGAVAKSFQFPMYKRDSATKKFSCEQAEIEAVTEAPEHRPKLERRASMGRVRFINEPTVWEFNDTFATQIQLPQTFDCQVDHTVSDRAPRAPTRPSLQRRHSTGCVVLCDDEEQTEAATHGFWQSYETDHDSPPKPMRSNYARRRTVRFAQHVTVFVFPKNGFAESELSLPNSFVRRPPARSMPLRESRNTPPRRSSEDRFEANVDKHQSTCLPKIPRRRYSNGSGRKSKNIGLPQTGGQFDVTPLPESSKTSPKIPQRRRQDEPQIAAPSMPRRRPSLQGKQTPRISFPERENDPSDSSGFDHCDSFSSDTDDEVTFTGESLETFGTNDDSYDDDARRERAKMCNVCTYTRPLWRRWAMPNYETMKQTVQNTSYLDITIEDVDLLPWDSAEFNRARYDLGRHSRRRSCA